MICSGRFGHRFSIRSRSGSEGAFFASSAPLSARRVSEIGIFGSVSGVCSTPWGVLSPWRWRRTGRLRRHNAFWRVRSSIHSRDCRSPTPTTRVLLHAQTRLPDPETPHLKSPRRPDILPANPHFLVAFFNSAFGKRLVLGRIAGAAQKHFNITAAKEVMLHVPPMAEQHAIVDMVDSLREGTQRLARVCERKPAALEALKKSLLHQAFSGEL